MNVSRRGSRAGYLVLLGVGLLSIAAVLVLVPLRICPMCAGDGRMDRVLDPSPGLNWSSTVTCPTCKGRPRLPVVLIPVSDGKEDQIANVFKNTRYQRVNPDLCRVKRTSEDGATHDGCRGRVIFSQPCPQCGRRGSPGMPDDCGHSPGTRPVFCRGCNREFRQVELGPFMYVCR